MGKGRKQIVVESNRKKKNEENEGPIDTETSHRLFTKNLS